MSLDLLQDRTQAHALVDLVPATKLPKLCQLLEALIHDDSSEEVTPEEFAAIERGIESLDAGKGVPMHVILDDLGLTQTDFDEFVAGPSLSHNG